MVSNSSWGFELQQALKEERVEFEHAASLPEGLNIFHSERHDLVVMEIGDDYVKGAALLRAISQISRTPIIVILATAIEAIKIETLNAGADFVLSVPFSMKELASCARCAMRRVPAKRPNSALDESQPAAASRRAGRASTMIKTRRALPLVRGNLTLDPLRSCVRLGSEEIDLTVSEYRVLELLMLNERRIVTKNQILGLFYQEAGAKKTRIAQVYMSRVRLKLRALCGEEEAIANIKGAGWVFRAPSSNM
jgi:DNA-binding response OmpR family regulator